MSDDRAGGVPPLPAWSEAFTPDRLRTVRPLRLPTPITREWAWGSGTGAGVRVAVVDSGIDATHPAVGSVQGGVVIEPDDSADRADGADSADSADSGGGAESTGSGGGGPSGIRIIPGSHDDLFGHGTACAGIIRALAPDCELYSVRVLGPALTGRGRIFAAGLRWAIENGMDVVNLSLSTRSRTYLETFYELVDEAVFRNVMLVCAVNNVPAPSYPSQFAGVFSVAAYQGRDPEHFAVNPEPPVEFGAPGIDVEVAWTGGGTIVATGNSFAAPHIAGLLARIVGRHRPITTGEAKAVLRALADNAEA